MTNRILAFAGLLIFSVCGILCAEDCPCAQNKLTEQEKNAGFELLFDGNTISQDIWQGSIDGYPVEEAGSFICRQGENEKYRENE